MKPISRRHVLGGLAKARKSLENELRPPIRGSNAGPGPTIHRRGYVKYAAAGVVAVAAGVAGYHIYETETPTPTWTESPTQSETATVTPKVNHPPIVSDIKVWPKYIRPTPGYTVRFSHDSYDLDGDPLTTRWVLDGREVSREPEYATKLSEGVHVMEMHVSDGSEEKFMPRLIEVEPSQIYPIKELKVPIKGICYFAHTFWKSNRSEDEIEEHLGVINRELGCNGIRIEGYKDETILAATEMAVNTGFDEILVCPIYEGYNKQQTAQRVGTFATKLEKLRAKSNGIVFQVGNEFTFDSEGIIKGSTWSEKVLNAAIELSKPGWKNRFKDFIKEVIGVARKNYGGRLSYAAMALEPVPWELFDIIGRNEYIAHYRSAGDILKDLNALKKYNMPIYLTEFGCCSFEGADKWGGEGIVRVGSSLYDEEVQKDYISNFIIKVVNKSKVNGCFLFDFDSLQNSERRWFGIIDSNHRKKGFYMYKSYVVKR